MKLYISYYGNYITIVEGMYNQKRDKYNIKNINIITEDDVEIDSKDKYSLLRQALYLNKFKTKDVVFSLNTRDVIIKSNNIQKVNPKDLDGIMQNEMYEMMSLDYDDYTFSYEVMSERKTEEKIVLDVVIAAILNDELSQIMEIFKSFKLNVECIDTMSTAYARLLKKVEYDDIMMLNIGRYGSFVNIYKEDSLFIHDNIPVRVNNLSNYAVALSLVDEVKGLNNFYSSRNFGKAIDTIVLLGESNNNEFVVETFKESFNSKVVIGIENLFDIVKDIQGDIQSDEVSKICDVLGSMSNLSKKKDYSSMNLLPLSLRNKKKKNEKLRKVAILAPVSIGILVLPYIGLEVVNNKAQENILISQGKLNEITLQYKGIQDIDNEISKLEEEIAIYDMLSSKHITWGEVLSAIDKNIPYRADLTNINVYYDSTIGQEDINEENIDTNDESKTTESTENSSEETEKTEEKSATPIYEQIPNIINLEGVAVSPEQVGQFMFSLNTLPYFESVELKSSTKDEANEGHIFNITLVLKEGVVTNEQEAQG